MPPAEQTRPDRRPDEVLEALERLAGAAAHDYGNALTVVLSVSAALLRAIESGEPVAADDVAQLAAAAARAEELTRHLLAFSRRRHQRPEPLDLNGAVERARAELARLAGARVELILDLATGLPPALADPAQLAEALRCLVDNARQALPQGGQVRVATATLDLRPGDAGWPALAPGAYVRLEVSDDGAGMSPAVRERALDPLFTTRRSGRGIGLGLAIADGVARAAGGALRLEAAPGAGTRVALALPCGQAPDERSAAPAGGTESILLVEGDARLRGLMLRALAGAGYEVHVAGDAGEALAGADSLARPPRLLLAELPPPGQAADGPTGALRRRWPDLRVLFTSSHSDASDARPGASDPILAKPFSPGELLARVRALLDAPGGAPSAGPGGRSDPM